MCTYVTTFRGSVTFVKMVISDLFFDQKLFILDNLKKSFFGIRNSFSKMTENLSKICHINYT